MEEGTMVLQSLAGLPAFLLGSKKRRLVLKATGVSLKWGLDPDRPLWAALETTGGDALNPISKLIFSLARNWVSVSFWRTMLPCYLCNL